MVTDGERELGRRINAAAMVAEGPTSCATVLRSVLGRKSVGPVVELVIYPQCAPETRETHTGEPLRRRFLERNKGASSC